MTAELSAATLAGPSVPAVLPGVGERPADVVWALVAPAVASIDARVRLSRDGGASYPGRWERRLGVRPGQPAAVRLYDRRGHARVLALDLDAKVHGRAQVLADTAAAVALLTAAGGVPVVDESVSGGRHVYLLLAQGYPVEVFRPVLVALGALLPTLDPTPMLNARSGCLRPAGSAHPRGGVQTLVTPWAQVVRAVNVRAAAPVWDRLLTGLGLIAGGGGGVTGGAATRAAAAVPALSSPATGVSASGGVGGALPEHLNAIATAGRWDRDRYATGSEARYAVLCSLLARGWSAEAVLAQLDAGAWPGLAGLYARYRGQWRKALLSDWANATNHIHAPLPNFVSGCNTREPSPHPPREVTPQRSTSREVTSSAPAHLRRELLDVGAQQGGVPEYRWIRSWWATVQLAVTEVGGAAGLSRRAVLHALGAAAQKTGSRTVAFGCRSLALASGVDHSTVSRVLRDLRAEDDPFLELLEEHRGPAGDLYQLRIPDRLLTVAATTAWPKGPVPGVHPVFRVLGLAAWAAHHSLTHTRRQPRLSTDPASSDTDSTDPSGTQAGAVPMRRLVGVPVDELSTACGLSRAATYRALDVLADAGLARRVPGGWATGTRALDRAAELLGATSLVAALKARYAAERAAWRTFLRLLTDGPEQPASVCESAAWAGEYPGYQAEPPPEPAPSPLQLLYDILGAIPVEP